MRDLELENSLKGIRSQQGVSPDNKSHLPADLEKDIEALAEELAGEEIQNRPPETELMSLDAYKARLKEEYKEKLQMRDVGESLAAAISMIIRQGRNYLDLEGFTRVLDEFEMAFDTLMKMDAKEGIDKTFKELTAISDETVGHIEQMAIQKYQEHDFVSSGRLFVLLTVLSPNSFMYWMRLGINYQEVGAFKEALKSYANAFNLNAINIPNHLFMAECYVELKDISKAAQECEILKTLMETQDVEGRWKEHFGVLEKVVNEMK